MKTIKHIELNGGYSGKRKIIIDACELFGEYEIMAMYEDNGLMLNNELDCKTVATEEEAEKIFNDMVLKYAGDLQKALYNKLVEGEKYTLVYLNDFGFPVAQKIIFSSMELTTYAQYGDVVKMIFKPYRKRNLYRQYFYSNSLMVFKGWQDMKEEDTHETLKDNESVKITMSKYACFDSQYIDDLEKVFKNPVVIYKNYKVGKNGKLYA